MEDQSQQANILLALVKRSHTLKVTEVKQDISGDQTSRDIKGSR
jgi:hypothetical protein